MLGGSLSPWHGASSGCGWREVLWVWSVTVNLLNKQSQTADKGGPPAWGLNVGLQTPHHKKFCIVTKCFKAPQAWTESLA